MTSRAKSRLGTTIIAAATGLLMFFAAGGMSLFQTGAKSKRPLPSRVSVYGEVVDVTDDCRLMVNINGVVTPVCLLDCIPVGDGKACVDRLRELTVGRNVKVVVVLPMIASEPRGLPAVVGAGQDADVAHILRREGLADLAPDGPIAEFFLQ
jgi:hypothetical protein